MEAYLNENYISNNNQYYGEDSSRKEAIEKITKCLENQQKPSLDCTTIKLPYIIGPYRIGKTKTLQYTINKHLHSNFQSEYKIYLVGSHEEQLSLIEIFEQIINQEKKIFQIDYNKFLLWICELLKQGSNSLCIHEAIKKKIMEENFREQLEKKYKRIEEAIQDYHNINGKSKNNTIKGRISELMTDYFMECPEIKKYFILSVPNFNNNQNKEIRNFFLSLKDKNITVSLIKEGRFHLNEIELKENKNYE